MVALAGDILRRKALNHILEQASPVDADGKPVDLTPPGYEEVEAEDEDDDTGPADAEEAGSAAAASDAGADSAEPADGFQVAEADEDSPDEADE